MWVRLGCTPEERAYVQPISVQITLHMQNTPPGCNSDLLEETYCYQAMIERVELALKDRQFNLVEHLGMTIWEWVRLYIDEAAIDDCGAALEVSVTKLNPPIPNLNGGVTFTYKDL
ncbi:MAG: dihydroneopterin aldolase [Proteobacteria bacterium]|nr:dihydroneopterin aldolase [Pseudomonadota bacterium]